jgi:ankyrin repeat protein
LLVLKILNYQNRYCTVKLLPLLTLCFIYVLPALAMEIEHKKIKVDAIQSDAPIEKVPSLTELVTHFLARYEVNEEQSLTAFRTKLNELYSILPNYLTISFFNKVLKENKTGKRFDEVDLAIILAEYLMQKSIESDQELMQKSYLEKIAYIQQHAQPGTLEHVALELVKMILNHPSLVDMGQLRSTTRAVCFGCPLVCAALVQAQKEKDVDDLAQALRQLIYLRKDDEACTLIDLLPPLHASFRRYMSPTYNLADYALTQGCLNTQQALTNKQVLKPHIITTDHSYWYPAPWHEEGFLVGDVSRVSSFITEFPKAAAAPLFELQKNPGHSLNSVRLKSSEFGYNIIPLLHAIKHHHTGVANILLDRGVDPYIEDSGGNTALSLACATNDVTLVHRLLMTTAQKHINQRTINGKVPLHIACVQGNLPLVVLLLTNGADVNLKVQPDRKKLGGIEDPYYDGNTPLHLACYVGNQEIAASLIEHGANIQELNFTNDNPLYSACKHKGVNVVPLLVSKAAQAGLDMNLFILDKHLLSVIALQRDDILELLLKYRTDSPSVEVLNSACEKPNVKCVNLILEAGTSFIEQDHKGNTSLHYASTAATSFDNALLLLKKARSSLNEESYNRYINTTNKDGFTPFLVACKHRNNAFIKHFLDSHRDTSDLRALHLYLGPQSVPVELSIVESLFKNVHDINALYEGDALLHKAIECDTNSLPIVNFLISRGADTTIKNEESGTTPLHYDVSPAILKLLLGNGAHVNQTDDAGWTPLHSIVEQYGRPYLKYGNDVECQKSITVLLEYGAVINASDNNGDTPLHFACRAGFNECALFLVEQGALCTFKNQKGNAPIHYECHYGQQNLALIKLFLEKGALLDKDLKGKTPLHYCLRNKNVEEETQQATIDLLLANGANINEIDKHGNTILHYAYEQNASKIIKFLIEKGASVSIPNKNGKIPSDLAPKK